MNNKGIGLVVVLVLVIGVLTLLFNNAFNISNIKRVETKTPVTDEVDDLNVLPVIHAFGGGLHTYVGEINLPTPCHELDNSVEIAESFPEQVTINFVTKTKTQMCAQYIVPEPFSVSFAASRGARVFMTLNDEPLLFKETMLDVPDMFIKDEEATTTKDDEE